jgi:hypothetical protein
MATTTAGVVIDLTSEKNQDVSNSSTPPPATDPEIIDLSSEGPEVPRQLLTPVSPICQQYPRPLVETRGRPKNGRRNFLPNAHQIKHDEIYESASSEIPTIHQSNQWHYQHIISGMNRINDLIFHANINIAQNLLDAELECRPIDTNYILVYDQPTLKDNLFDSYLRFCSETTNLDCKFSHLVRNNTGVMSRLYCDDPGPLMQKADERKIDQCLLGDRQEPPRTPVKRRCRSLEPPRAPVKKIRLKWLGGKASKMNPVE